MPNVYLKNELYDEIVRSGADVIEFVNTNVENALQQKRKAKKT
jgi:hypothetical protein